MPKLIDMTGKKFGRLTIIKRMSDKYKHTTWLCKCKCGKEKIIRRDSLINGTKSCGCLIVETIKKRMSLPFGIASMRELIRICKASAKKRGYKYELTEKQFIEITKRDCYYCGAKPSKTENKRHVNGIYIGNGIDRINNNKGYTIDNVVPCCKICNQAKHTLTLQEFKDWIVKVYNFQVNVRKV